MHILSYCHSGDRDTVFQVKRMVIYNTILYMCWKVKLFKRKNITSTFWDILGHPEACVSSKDFSQNGNQSEKGR